MDLDFRTLTFSISVLFVFVGMTMSLFNLKITRTRAWAFGVYGVTFLGIGILVGTFKTRLVPSPFLLVGNDLEIFGLAALVFGVRKTIGLGFGGAYCAAISALHAIGWALAFFLAPRISGFRIISLSVAMCALLLPVALSAGRGPSRFEYMGLLRALAALTAGFAAARIVLALVKLTNDPFVTGGLDSILVLLMYGFGLAGTVTFIKIAASRKRAKPAATVYVSRDKPRLSLTEKGLSPTQISYVLSRLEGKSVKVIALQNKVQESTVRNSLARAYKKLQIYDNAGLVTLGERYEVVS
jgi:DNA-binding CsgD family transcriptional regulator